MPVASVIPALKSGATRRGDEVSYHGGSLGGWTFRFDEDVIHLLSSYRADSRHDPIVLRFNPEITHATLLGLGRKDHMQLPALLHLPGEGSLEIEERSAHPVLLHYDARRRGMGYVEVGFPAATQGDPQISYTLRVKALYAPIPGIEANPLFDGYRRNFLNALQMHAEFGVLANNSSSDPCAFGMYMYSEIAKYAPPLAPGFSALDLVRTSLDRYLDGFTGYGLPGFRMFDADSDDGDDSKIAFLDTYPSLLIAAHDYASTTHDLAWLRKRYPGLRAWTEKMLLTDTTGDGLLKYGASGNSGSWKIKPDGQPALRPANWWDTIGFGYEDAYSNALAYHALQGMAEMALEDGQGSDAERYTKRARLLRANYLKVFLNPKTGVLAGWRSEDGALHDYYFTFVTGAAIYYGLVPDDVANSIFDRLFAKMNDVGFSRFGLGLPGNLIPIRKEDYTASDQRWGAPTKDDGSDGFQVYENGAATASYTYFTIVALYQLGRIEDGDRILKPMLESFRAGAFEGRGPNGFTNDWKAWDGTPSGYEGFLADNYMALAAVLRRPVSSPPLK